MQGKYLFEYAVLRIMPRVEREEFLNAGVILYCAGLQFLQAKYRLDKPRLLSFHSKLDIAELEEYFCAVTRICAGGSDARPIGDLPIAARFRWLTATRSTVVQTSRVHPGFCNDPAETLERLYNELAM